MKWRDRRKAAKSAAQMYVDLAAAAYRYVVEHDNHPAPDHVMKRVTRDEMFDIVKSLHPHERAHLKSHVRRG